MGDFIDNIPEQSLDSWYRWLTYFSIGIPILGAILGGLCGFATIRVSGRINELQAVALKHAEKGAKEARELARQRRLSSEETAKMLVVAHQFCSEIKRIPITAANGNQEAQAYALDFVNVFKDEGLYVRFGVTDPRPDSRRSRRQSWSKEFSGHSGAGQID